MSSHDDDSHDSDGKKKAVHVDCRKLVALLDDYVDESLAPEVKQAFDGHMHQCAPCTAFLRQYRFAPEAARRVLLQEVPADLENRLLGFLRQRCKKD